MTLNCGYGHGFSVLEVIDTVKRVSGVDFKVDRAAPRPAIRRRSSPTSDRIRAVLGWKPQFDDLDDDRRHALAWERHSAGSRYVRRPNDRLLRPDSRTESRRDHSSADCFPAHGPGGTAPPRRPAYRPLSRIARAVSLHERKRHTRRRFPPHAAVAGGRHRQAVPGAPRLVRRPQLPASTSREMGQDEREPPFFFAKPADAVVPRWRDGPLPVAHQGSASRGRTGGGAEERRPQHPGRQGARLHLRLRRRHRPDPPRPADRLAQHQAAVGDRQGVRRLGAVRRAAAGLQDRPSDQGQHQAQVQRQGRARTATSSR